MIEKRNSASKDDGINDGINDGYYMAGNNAEVHVGREQEGSLAPPDQAEKHIVIMVAGAPKSGKSTALNNIFNVDFYSSSSAVTQVEYSAIRNVFSAIAIDLLKEKENLGSLGQTFANNIVSVGRPVISMLRCLGNNITTGFKRHITGLTSPKKVIKLHRTALETATNYNIMKRSLTYTLSSPEQKWFRYGAKLGSEEMSKVIIGKKTDDISHVEESVTAATDGVESATSLQSTFKEVRHNQPSHKRLFKLCKKKPSGSVNLRRSKEPLQRCMSCSSSDEDYTNFLRGANKCSENNFDYQLSGLLSNFVGWKI